MTQQQQQSSKKNVLILGAGFGGIAVAKALDGNKSINVTIVSPRDFVLVKFGGLRAATTGGAWMKRVMVPVRDAVKNTKVVIAKAVKVEPEKKTVTLSTGEVLPYDVLVCATGSRNFSIAEPPVGNDTVAQTEAYYQATRIAVQNSKSIVVVGGGATGLETVGEVCEAVKHRRAEVKITLVAGKSGLLSSTVPAFPASFTKHWRELLAKQNVDVVDDTLRFAGDMLTGSAIRIPDEKKVTLESGKVIEGVDFVLFALGSRIQAGDIYPPAWLDETSGELNTDPRTLRLVGSKDVFGVGDLAKTWTTKIGYYARVDAAAVAANVLLALQGKEPTAKIQRTKGSMMLIPFGPAKGLSYLPFGEVGGFTTSLIKGKGLFGNTVWNSLVGRSAPPVVVA